MKKLLAGAFALALLAGPAFADPTGWADTDPNNPTVRIPREASKAYPLPTQCVSGCGGGSFQISPAITVQNAAYAAGNSEGGLITLTGAARTNGGTGTLQNIRLKSAGGGDKHDLGLCVDKVAGLYLHGQGRVRVQ
jgi:hypothetical protein